jgi:hypothetical protein
MTDTVTSQNIDLSSLDTLYTLKMLLASLNKSQIKSPKSIYELRNSKIFDV